ncbi:hypothetical protein DERF_001534 [Dermatophagoides farinae]|uniref:Uncharacterized protein n=1 Tax=Dermatophagoides farinae TaxID=6954 RepID=A0A922I9P7_DERFA|nr:hypothetical protein DERF_001534 [Dermatophagoides farinae]
MNELGRKIKNSQSPINQYGLISNSGKQQQQQQQQNVLIDSTMGEKRKENIFDNQRFQTSF